MPFIPSILRPLLEHSVAVLGAGVSGEGVAALLRHLGVDSIIYDQSSKNPDTCVFPPSAMTQHRLAIFSPGFRSDHDWLARAREQGITCISELDFAAHFWNGKIVAVTGTNGKTTLTEFLVHALKAAGQSACAVGNIGFPFSRIHELNMPPASIAVCEVSSFQAETLQHFRADACLWTNLAEDHLERHEGMKAYFAAKALLLERTKPSARFIGSSVQLWSRQLKQTLSDVVLVKTEDLLDNPNLSDSPFSRSPQRENFELARAWWRAEQLDEALLYTAAQTFQIGRHRLQHVASYGGISWWNDSKATNFHATNAAVRNFHVPVRLIAGGKSKGGDIRNFTCSLAGHVKKMYLIGQTAQEVAAGATEAGIAFIHCKSLAEAVERANADSRPGDQILLSPGFSSLDMFKNYEDRGDQFEAAVRKITSDPTHPPRRSL